MGLHLGELAPYGAELSGVQKGTLTGRALRGRKGKVKGPGKRL